MDTKEVAMLSVRSPVSGTAVGLAEVPDPVFARGLVGPGVAVTPPYALHEAVSPIDGVVVKVHPHAFVIADDQGRGVLVHLGIDTVRLDGAGFEVLLDGDGERPRVTAGTPVVRWNPADVEAHGFSVAVPVVALDAAEGSITHIATGTVKRGEHLFQWA